MKKILIIILSMITLLLTGCFKNSVVPNTNEIHLYLDEEFTKHMNYEEVPSFVFSFNGVINTIKHVPETHYTLFASNDDVILSAEISNLIEQYRDRTVFVTMEAKNESTTKINTLDKNGKQISHNYRVDDGKVINEVAHISLPNGLKLTIEYRRFVSDGITYYAWTYANPMSMYLYYPLMVIKEDNQKEIVLLALPSQIKFQVSPNLEVGNILKKDEYLKKEKYSFEYLSTQKTLTEKQDYIRNYYIEEHNGYEEDGKFYFSYLNVLFLVTFYEEGFDIRYVSKL